MPDPVVLEKIGCAAGGVLLGLVIALYVNWLNGPRGKGVWR